MNKYFKYIAILIIFIFVFLLSGCSRQEISDDSTIDYNEYLYGIGFTVYTSDRYIFNDDSILKVLYADLSSPIYEICNRPECLHNNESCPAKIDSGQIFYSSGKLLFIQDDSDGRWLYEMNLNGEDRHKVMSLKPLDKSSIGFSAMVYNNDIILNIIESNIDVGSQSIVLADISKNSEFLDLWKSNDIADESYVLLKAMNNWIYAARIKDETTLVAYDIETQNFYEIASEWKISNTFAMRNNMLYCFDIEEGFFQIDLETFQRSEYVACKASSGYMPGIFDDKYVYLNNTVPPLDNMNIIPEEERGLYIYDYEGNLKLKILTGDKKIYPNYLMTTFENVLISDWTNPNLPVWYLDKSKIESGIAELIMIPQE